MAALLEVGNWLVRSIVTGHLRLDGGAMFGVVPKTLWSRVAPADEQNRILLTTRTLVAMHRLGGRIVLVDTGTGSKWAPEDARRYAIESKPAAIDEALAEAGVGAADVTDIVVTHLHFDHCGGLTERTGNGDRLRLRFPQARHWVHRDHWAHAHRPTLRDRASFVPDDFSLLADEGKLVLVEGPKPAGAIDDLSWTLAHGHTPSQLLPVFRGGEADLLFVGDLIPTAAHLPPAWVMGYDLQPLVALQERLDLYQRCRTRPVWLAFPHDPERGIVSLAIGEKKPTIASVLG